MAWRLRGVPLSHFWKGKSLFAPALYQTIRERAGQLTRIYRRGIAGFENLDSPRSLDATPWTAPHRYTAPAMKSTLAMSLALVASMLTIGWGQATQSRASGALTIEQLIDIRHPSNPVWSPDGRTVAFLSERAGIANI